jgi:hypothetical protein
MGLEFELDLTGIGEDDLEGDFRCTPGRYHIHINDASRDEKLVNPCCRLRYTILNGTDPSAVGMVLEERLYFTERARKRAATFAKRLQILDPGAYGKSSSIDFTPVIGMQAIVEIHDEEYTKKDGSKGKSSKITFAGIWSVDDPRTKDVPRGKVPDVPNGKATPKPKATPADDFGDL